jgi:amino-acid N-acetyltransferase
MKDYREQIIQLLAAEKLPVDDLPETLENFELIIQNGEVIAVAGLEIYAEYGLIRSVAVNKDFRGRGFADQLIKKVEAHRGLKEIYLLTETAAAYFEKRGYQTITRMEVPDEVQQSPEFSHVCPQSAIVMKKIIIK